MNLLFLCGAVVCSALVSAEPVLDIVVVDSGANSNAARALGETLGKPPIAVDAIANLSPQTLLTLIDAHDFPGRGFGLVKGYVAKGGHLLVAGETPFEAPLFESDGHWISERELLGRVAPEHPLVDWAKTDSTAWRRGASQPKAYAKYERIDNGLRGEAEMADPLGWENIEIPCLPAANAGDDVLRFRASGGDRAKSLLVELRENDGARWMAVAPLTAEEREVGLHASVFKYWRDSTSSARGGNGDCVRFDNLRSIAVGFALSHQPLEVGRYTFTVHGMATGKLGGGFTRPEPLVLEGLCPAYKVFEARPASYAADDKTFDVPITYPASVLSPVARGMRVVPDREYVWQPLVKGFDAQGTWCATPVSTLWHKSGATWTYLGFTPDSATLAAVCRRMAASLQTRPTFEEGVGPLLAPVSSGECVKVHGGDFVVNGARWFAHGINFWPLYVAGLETSEYAHNWLVSRFYYPDLVEQDLTTLESIGVNLVSVQYNQVDEAPQLRDFVARCGRHRIKVNIFLGGAHPISPSATDDLSKRPMIALLRALSLAGNPDVFAYDLAWEPIVGNHTGRKALDSLFQAWVQEQYGSVEHAEKSWGASANRVNGELAGPTDDEQLTRDGAHRTMVAAYRRFLDDLISRRYREVIRLARAIDPTHLFGARTGYGGTGTMGVVPNMPFQLTSGAAHLDFISPEGYGYGPKNIADAALVNQYARWAGQGKPVFWAEFGLSVWKNQQVGLDQQGKLYEAFADMTLRTGAAGWAPWWYPGGYRVDEQSDYGIVAPDRTLRPSATLMRRMGPELKKGSPSKAGASLMFARDAKPQGIAATVSELSSVFAEAYNAGQLPELRTSGTGTDSSVCPLTSVGGVPHEALAPAEYLNAELWIESRENGRVRIAMINTGEASWRTADCSLRMTDGSRTETLALSKDVAPFATIVIECADPGAGQFFAYAKRFGAFGERLHLVRP